MNGKCGTRLTTCRIMYPSLPTELTDDRNRSLPRQRTQHPRKPNYARDVVISEMFTRQCWGENCSNFLAQGNTDNL